MVDIVQQPHGLNPTDREQLAMLGYRIDLWNSAPMSVGTLSDRTDALVIALVQHLTMIVSAPFTTDPIVIRELEADIHDLFNFQGSDEQFAEFCEERAHYYVEVRVMFIQDDLAEHSRSGPDE